MKVILIFLCLFTCLPTFAKLSPECHVEIKKMCGTDSSCIRKRFKDFPQKCKDEFSKKMKSCDPVIQKFCGKGDKKSKEFAECLKKRGAEIRKLCE